MRVAQPKPEHKDFVDKAGAQFASNMSTAIEKFWTMMEGRQASVAMIEEAPLLHAGGRFLTQPVKAGAAG